MGMGLRVFSLIAIAISLSACASKSVDRAGCDQRDWYELGRHDGAQGSTNDQLSKYSSDCRRLRPDWESMYANGRNAGLVEYCTSENGFELGRMGITYMYVCPSQLEPAFLSGYRKGQRARALEIENKNLDTKIDLMTEKLDQASQEFERGQLARELKQLRAKREQNQKELNKTVSN